VEAFISTGSNIFEPALIHKQIKYVMNIKSIPKPKLIPNTISRFYGREFLLFEQPERGKRYYFGVDVSEGIGRDSSVIEILDEEGRQVAEFATNKIKPYEFAGVIHDLAIYFNYAYLVIEKASAGHTVIDKLRHEYKYKNMHKHKEYDSRGRAKKKVGWVTNGKTKSMMIADFVELWETNQIYIHSKDLLGEMKLFIAKDNGKIEAQGKTNHDDRVMAFAMALQGIKSNVWYK
jgi:hypothetical protein